jgi:hypothetical protein
MFLVERLPSFFGVSDPLPNEPMNASRSSPVSAPHSISNSNSASSPRRCFTVMRSARSAISSLIVRSFLSVGLMPD